MDQTRIGMLCWKKDSLKAEIRLLTRFGDPYSRKVSAYFQGLKRKYNAISVQIQDLMKRDI